MIMLPRILMYMKNNNTPFDAETFNPLLKYYANEDRDHDQAWCCHGAKLTVQVMQLLDLMDHYEVEPNNRTGMILEKFYVKKRRIRVYSDTVMEKLKQVR